MRRRRQQLQVSTFPFLAVLLCAMGSLMLLLLVIDRRAKVVARNKAAQAVEHAETEKARAAEARRARLERGRRELHLLLSGQEQDLLRQIGQARGKVDASLRGLEAEQLRAGELQTRVQGEAGLLTRKQEELAARRAGLGRAEQQTDAVRAEI